MSYYSGSFPVVCPYCNSEDFDDPQDFVEIDKDVEVRIVRCKECGQFYEAIFSVDIDYSCRKISETQQEELQRKARHTEYRAELEKMGQCDLPFEEITAEEAQNVSKPKSA
jgi:transcription elongation factor Elf1